MSLFAGLDAALPLFANPNVNMKLDASDANFVDVIHTNMGIFGKMEPSGHVDFYVNGGYLQPACNNSMSMNPFINCKLKYLQLYLLLQIRHFAAT